MDELQTIREAWAKYDGADMNYSLVDLRRDILAALARLEARDTEIAGTIDLISAIQKKMGLAIPGNKAFFDRAEVGAMIGQYAYRYSEDIRKDRDYWRMMAVQYADAVKAKDKPKGWQDACPNCGESPLIMETAETHGYPNSAIAVCQSCKKPMPEGWHSIHGPNKIPGSGE